MAINEVKKHGTENFPIELYCLNNAHSKYLMTAHWHKSIEFIRVISGTLSLRLDERIYQLNSGDYFIANIEVVHSAVPKNCIYECVGIEIDFLNSTNSFMKNFINDLSIKNIFINEKIQDENTISILENLFETLKNKPKGFQFTSTGLIFQFFGIIFEKGLYSTLIPKNNDTINKNLIKLKKSLAFIRENYDQQITLEDITATTGFSTKYFCKFFKSFTDKTPIDYLNFYRIEMACKKITNSDASITEIAYSCGFNDLSYFIKTFKKIKGITPRKYKE